MYIVRMHKYFTISIIPEKKIAYSAGYNAEIAMVNFDRSNPYNSMALNSANYSSTHRER